MVLVIIPLLITPVVGNPDTSACEYDASQQQSVRIEKIFTQKDRLRPRWVQPECIMGKFIGMQVSCMVDSGKGLLVNVQIQSQAMVPVKQQGHLWGTYTNYNAQILAAVYILHSSRVITNHTTSS